MLHGTDRSIPSVTLLQCSDSWVCSMVDNIINQFMSCQPYSWQYKRSFRLYIHTMNIAYIAQVLKLGLELLLVVLH